MWTPTEEHRSPSTGRYRSTTSPPRAEMTHSTGCVIVADVISPVFLAHACRRSHRMRGSRSRWPRSQTSARSGSSRDFHRSTPAHLRIAVAPSRPIVSTKRPRETARLRFAKPRCLTLSRLNPRAALCRFSRGSKVRVQEQVFAHGVVVSRGGEPQGNLTGKGGDRHRRSGGQSR
jgi:hypothetical protein